MIFLVRVLLFVFGPKSISSHNSVLVSQAFLAEIGTVGWGGPHLEKWLRYAEDGWSFLVLARKHGRRMF